MNYIIGVDAGGTFTDAVAIDDAGRVVTGKAPTTPDRLLITIEVIEDVVDRVRKVVLATEDRFLHRAH